MSRSNGFTVEVNGVTFDVEFCVSGHGGDCELEELTVFIGDQDVTDVLKGTVITKLEDACFDHLPEPEQPEPDEFYDFGDQSIDIDIKKV